MATSTGSSRQWPTVRLHKNRRAFTQRVCKESLQSIESTLSGKGIEEQIALTIYKEKLCLKRMPWPVDDVRGEHLFWQRIELQFLRAEKKKEPQSAYHRILQHIIKHYVKGIHSRFQRPHFQLAKGLSLFIVHRLLSGIGFSHPLKKDQGHQEKKFRVGGEIAHVQALSKKGTVVLLPTHFSNLDSIIIGGVALKLGLPPLMYGAGLNLFNMRLLAYFMDRVGAYKIDRRKKNLIYLETLNVFTKSVLAYGCPLLFFPGGTRSRMGVLNEKLKLGMLSNTVSAQRELLQQKRKKKKIFLVPVVLNYHFVLEAPALIRQYLKKTGQARYYADDDMYSTSYRIFSFLVKFFTKRSEVSVSIGHPMDVVGNYVDKAGQSIGPNGRVIDISGYFKLNGRISEDKQREREYTRLLSRRINEVYYRYNEVLVSHVVAFTAFRLMRKVHNRLDLYDFLRLPEEDLWLDRKGFLLSCGRVRDAVVARAASGQLRHEARMQAKIDSLIAVGVSYCGMYHTARPLVMDRAGRIGTRDIHTLYYYHNRLSGYDLETYV